MKKVLIVSLAIGFSLFGMSGVASALFVDDNGTIIDVGGLDSFVAQGTNADVGNSGDASELAWINMTLFGANTSDYYLMGDYTKFDPPDWLEVYSDAGASIPAVPETWAFLLEDEPDYFLVKTGNNQTDPDYRYFLFANNINLDYAVFALQDQGYFIKNAGALSHAAQVGGGDEPPPPPPVPEPATMLLFGAGLAGLTGAIRRRKHQ